VLEGAGDARLLAMAYSNRSQLHALADQHAEAIEWGERAIRLAREVDDAAILSHALNSVGVAMWHRSDPRGQAMIKESLRVALAAGEVEHACRAYANLIWHLVQESRFAEAETYLAAGIELADRADHQMAHTYLHAELGALKLATGHWDEAARAAELGWAGPAGDAHPGAARPGPGTGAARPAGRRRTD
jgi:tetratricopeptide (TPR) repeat protein